MKFEDTAFLDDQSVGTNALLPDSPAIPRAPATPAPPKINPADFERSKEEGIAWGTTKAGIQRYLPLTEDGTAGTKLNTSLLRIDAEFKFHTENEDSQFIPLHVESLLDQAADLLERGIRQREVWSDLAEKSLRLSLELNEYRDLAEVHEEEERNGVYDIQWKRLQKECQAQKITTRNFGLLWNEAKSTYQDLFSSSAINGLHWANIRLAWLQGVIPYFSGDKPQYETVQVEKKKGHVKDHNVDATRVTSKHSIIVQQKQHLSQVWSNSGSFHSSGEYLQGMLAEYDWEKSKATTSRRRTKIARTYQEIKAKSAASADGVLNYSYRLNGIKNRFQQDFRDALARLKVANQGLRTVYGYTSATPTDPSSRDYFDNWLLWNRRAIHWLIRFSQLDQSFVLPISIRAATGKSWNTGLQNGAWRVPVVKHAFDGLAHVRLRGLSAFVVGRKVERDLWQVRARVPTNGIIEFLDGSERSVDQSVLPIARMARVTGYESRRPADIVGASSLMNASPIGNWHVEVVSSLSQNLRVSDLEDLVLQLHVTFRSKGSQQTKNSSDPSTKKGKGGKKK